MPTCRPRARARRARHARTKPTRKGARPPLAADGHAARGRRVRHDEGAPHRDGHRPGRADPAVRRSASYVTNSLEKSKHPVAHHAVISVLPDQIKAAHNATSAAKKEASENVDCDEARRPTRTRRTATPRPSRRRSTTSSPRSRRSSRRSARWSRASSSSSRCSSCSIPSLFGGQTLGKRLQKIRVVKTRRLARRRGRAVPALRRARARRVRARRCCCRADRRAGHRVRGDDVDAQPESAGPAGPVRARRSSSPASAE